MRVFCDTSVLVAASVAEHPHHARAKPLLDAVVQRRLQGVAALHSLAECWSALTTLLVSPRITAAEAARLVEQNVEQRFELLAPTATHYRLALGRCRDLGLSGGAIYDALLLETAREARVDRIFTFNLKDFRRLAPDLDGIVGPP